MGEAAWRIWVDTGGTFTDGLGVDPSGRLHRVKVLSSSALRARVVERPGERELVLDGLGGLVDGFVVGCRVAPLAGGAGPQVVASEGGRVTLDEATPSELAPGAACELRAPVEAPVLAAHLLTRTPLGVPLPRLAMRLATTRGTNALLERRGAPTALFITAGFGDLPAIGTQARDDLFALDVRRPPPLATEVVEVDERLAADGTVLRPPDLDGVRAAARRLLAGGITCAAVALLHAYRNPAHEAAVAAALREEGFAHVSESARLAPLIKLLPRATTAVVDATLTPVVGGYLERVAAAIPSGTLHVMTSAGGLVAAAEFRPKDALLSGPAGGVVGAALSGRRSGAERVISFDMGGTSTDVARWDGDWEYVFEHRVGDVVLVAPALAVETVAAGGGSICAFDGAKLTVGPGSAGADPGPACYGAGGPLAITDVNLLLGRIVPERFGIPVDEPAAQRALGALVAEVAGSGGAAAPERLAEGLLAIANERMASAIRRISVRRGYDPREHVLVAFGGAGGQHACALARLLGMTTVLVPPDASLLSARGLGDAVIERFAHRQVLRRLADAATQVEAWLAELAGAASRAVVGEGVPEGDVVIRRRIARLRLAGQETALDVDADPVADLPERFVARYRAVYGYDPPDRAVELESLRVVASTRPPEPEAPAELAIAAPAPASGCRRVWLDGGWLEVAVVEREAMAPGHSLDGPALVVEDHSVTLVEPGWRVAGDAAGALVLTRNVTGREHCHG